LKVIESLKKQMATFKILVTEAIVHIPVYYFISLYT